VINKANKYIEESKPWERAKKKSTEDLELIIKSLLETLRVISILIYSFMPATSEKIWKQLGFSGNIESVSPDEALKWDFLKEGTRIQKDKPLFPRIVI